mgnify:CR=1 FL=1
MEIYFIEIFFRNIFLFLLLFLLIDKFILNIDLLSYLFSLNFDNYKYDFLWCQISSTLIISSIIGFLSTFSSSYVYGKKQINVIFNSSGILSLITIIFILTICVFSSIIVCIFNYDLLILLCSFIISLIFILYMLLEVLFFYTLPYKVEEKLFNYYLFCERLHINEARPLDPKKSFDIEEFKYRTIEMIKKSDFDFKKNINLFLELLKISFYL